MNKVQEWLIQCKQKTGMTYQQIADFTLANEGSIRKNFSGKTFPSFYTFSRYIELFGLPVWGYGGDLRTVYDRVKKEK